MGDNRQLINEWVDKFIHIYYDATDPHDFSFKQEFFIEKVTEIIKDIIAQSQNQKDKVFGHEPNPEWRNAKDYMLQCIYWEQRYLLVERLLKHVFTHQEIGRAHHIADLESKLKGHQERVTELREVAEYRNKQLKATNLIISCTGGCETGVIGDPDKVTEELVLEVERTAKRIRSWFNNRQYRREQGHNG